ncbi:MAG: Ig-like domain-containing protein, partial [Candidatus Poseidoniales archaeon]
KSSNEISNADQIYTSGQLYIAEGTQIEQFECTNGADRIYDAEWATSIFTGDGDDYIWITGGNDTVDGGSGSNDTVKLNVSDLTSLSVENTAGNTVQISNDTGFVFGTVSNVETFEFYDTNDTFLNSYTWDGLLQAFVVQPSNSIPVFEVNPSNPYFSFQENSSSGTTVGIVNASDSDGDALEFSISGGAHQQYFSIETAQAADSSYFARVKLADSGGLDFDVLRNVGTIVPISGMDHVVLDLEVTVSDGSDSVAYTFHPAIFNLEEAPIAVDDQYSLNENSGLSTIDVLNNDYDPEGTPLVITNVVSNNGGIVSINSNNVSVDYTPAADFYGTEIVTYTVSDTGTYPKTSTGTLTVTVNAVNQSPLAVDDTHSVYENSASSLISVLDNDSDPENDNLTIINVGQTSSGGTVSINGAALSYTPAANFFGTDTFEYTVSDGALTDTALVTVSVVEILENDTSPPVLTSVSLSDTSISYGETLTLNYTATDDTGLGRVRVRLYNQDDQTNWFVYDSDFDGVITFTPDELVNTTGNWFVSFIEMTDSASPSNTAEYTSVGGADFYQSLAFEVVGPEPADSSPPVLTSVSLSDTSISYGE